MLKIKETVSSSLTATKAAGVYLYEELQFLPYKKKDASALVYKSCYIVRTDIYINVP